MLTALRPSNAKQVKQWLLVTLLPAGFWLLMALVHHQQEPGNAYTITHAEFTKIETINFSVTPDSKDIVKLPHQWVNHVEPIERYGLYRVNINIDKLDQEPYALYFPDLRYNLAVKINGHKVGDGGDFEPVMAHNWRNPLYFTVPTNNLVVGDNTVEIIVGSIFNGHGKLGTFYFGANRLLEPIYFRQFQSSIIGLIVTAGMLWPILIFIFILWFFRQHDTKSLWFSLAIFAAGTHNTIKLFNNNPFNDEMMPSYLMTVSLLWFGIFGCICISRYINVANPRLEKTKITTGSLFTITLFIIRGDSSTYQIAVLSAASLFIVFIGLLTLRTIIHLVSQGSNLQTKVLIAALLTVLSAGVHDVLFLLEIVDSQLSLIDYALPIFALAFCSVSLNEHIYGLNEAERLNRELESIIDAKTEEIAKNHEKIRDLERRQVLEEERSRIMRDLHDGVGSQLVSTLALLNNPDTNTTEVSDQIQESLDDLRLIIDSMDAMTDDLNGLLASFRSRLEPKLIKCGLTMDWHVTDLDKLTFDASKNLQILRILQESIANTIKHAHASRIGIFTKLTASETIIQISDNGQGFKNKRENSKGLKNMHARASKIGGKLNITNSHSGTSVALHLPTV